MAEAMGIVRVVLAKSIVWHEWRRPMDRNTMTERAGIHRFSGVCCVVSAPTVGIGQRTRKRAWKRCHHRLERG